MFWGNAGRVGSGKLRSHAMPRKNPKLILAASRTAEARRIIAAQHELIAKLTALGQPTLDAERSLQTYASSFKLLEDREHKIRETLKSKRLN